MFLAQFVAVHVSLSSWRAIAVSAATARVTDMNRMVKGRLSQ